MAPTIDLLLVHGIVLTMDPQRAILDDGAVAVDGGRILAVGPSAELSLKYQPRKTINCQHKIVMPGLIDAHAHGGHSLLKTIASDTLSIWMQVVTPVYFHFTTDEFWYIDGMLSALERLKFGVTCGVSVLGSQPRSDDPIFASNHARAYAEVGVREVIAVGPCGPPWPRPISRWVDGHRVERQVTFEETLAGAEAAIETWNHGADDRIRVFITPFTIVPSLRSWGPTPPEAATTLQPDDRELSRRVREIAQRHDTRIHSDAFGGMIRLAAQDEYGLLGPDVHLEACLGLAPDEVQILARTDTRVSYFPYPTPHRCPAPELMAAGVTVALASEGTAPRQSFDLFQTMRTARFMENHHYNDSAYYPAGKLLEMVTIDAARAIGWDDEIGSLEPGKKADIIVINLRKPHLSPIFMPVHRLINEAVGHDVETVIVDGQIIMEERKVLTVDELAALDAAQEEAMATVRRAGLEPYMQPPCWGSPYQTFDRPTSD